jgi:signal transduction histidine kinase
MSTSLESQRRWWFGANQLFEIFLKPIYSGPASENRLLGFLVVGYQIDESVASQISRIADSKVVFYYGNTVVISTLDPRLNSSLANARLPETGLGQPGSLRLGGERFIEATLDLSPNATPDVRLTVLRSYDDAASGLRRLNRLLLALGLFAVLHGSALVFLISHTFTRPLSNLLAGVRALEKGDFRYELEVESQDEVGELSKAFEHMRDSLLRSQQRLLESERLATIGRMASSISHDLRHSLAAIVANAEFLCESRLTGEQREELYQEVQSASHRMTELIDSLLEFSRPSDSLRPTYASVRTTVDRAVNALRSNPEFQNVTVEIRQSGDVEGWFDHRKLERVFFNLLLNAGQSLREHSGLVEMDLRGLGDAVEIMITDHGSGVPEPVRNTLFEPFVSSGKENGTGLGLTVVQKIVQDHGGEVAIERTSAEGTVFRVRLPFPAAKSATEALVTEEAPVHLQVSSARRG